MTYRVQIRDRAMNVFTFHDSESWFDSIDTAMDWALKFGLYLPIEIVWVHRESEKGVTT